VKIRIGISSCLLGKKVRYDGGHKLDPFLSDTLGKYVAWVPVCPEVEYGLSVPREAMRLFGGTDSPGIVTTRTGVNHTEGMLRWAAKKVRELENIDLCGFVFKSNSPSSGMRGVKVYTSSGRPKRRGVGIFAGLFMKRFPIIPVEDDERLHAPVLRENFFERVFVFKRCRELMAMRATVANLVSFHTEQNLLVLSHSSAHYRKLEQLVAHAGAMKAGDLYAEYIRTLMEGVKLIATVKKNVNVLQHIMEYFKERLTADEKRELIEVIENYHDGLAPLIIPMTLINHYVRKYNEPYLKRQYYLNPHPLELMLRNHG
jgi:uncharacterized protein YbgA (DUF1722 family)/uncharacterized protein YbbK (DUF523 family)